MEHSANWVQATVKFNRLVKEYLQSSNKASALEQLDQSSKYLVNLIKNSVSVAKKDPSKYSQPIRWIEELAETPLLIEYFKSHYKPVKETIDEALKELKSNEIKVERLIWMGKPAHFGFIFRELVDKGYIEEPKTYGDHSNRRLARVCMELFDIETSEDYLINSLDPAKNSLSRNNKNKFNIPNRTDL